MMASYNCEGCLGSISTKGKTTLQGRLVTLPINSPLIKLAIRPKKIPIGATQAITSNKKKLRPSFFLKKNMQQLFFLLKTHEKTSLLSRI